MGFDNECIPNVQSLAGEYFCPVCRLLVYPNEALQSQCTHLYCKACLTYVVSTTRACPYDGYLVTEADSKPLTESNKALAETIGKITVNCLYNRSGCTWQGTLTDSTSHCSGCAFGNSPVVCNRCGLQIVHRQVHEHAHTCTGVHSQVQPAISQTATATGTAATADQNQANAQAVVISSQQQFSQTAAVTTTGKDPNQKTNATTQPQTSMPAVTQTAEAWYQQQYQQYYQQYPGYDPYQQHYQQYYPSQQQAVAQYPQSQQQVSVQPQIPQSHPQVQIQPQAQPQVQPQSLPQAQQPVAAQPRNPLQQHVQHPVQPLSQGQAPFGATPAQPLLHPLAQQQMPAAQYQMHHLQMQHPQSQVQPQAQTQPNLQAQTQPHHQTFASQPMNPNLQLPGLYPSAQLVTGHQSYPQPQFQPQQQVQQVGAIQHPVQMLPHSGPQPQHSVQMHRQLPQQPTLLHPHAATQSMPQPNLMPLQALAQPPQPVHAQTLGISGNQHHMMQAGQQTMHLQHIQQQQQQPVLSGSSLGPVQSQAHQGPYSQLQPQGPPQLMQQPPEAFPLQKHGMQTLQAQGVAGRPMMPSHGLGMQLYPQSVVDVQKSAQSGVHTSEKGRQGELSNLKDAKQAPDEVDAAEVKPIRPESELGSVTNQIKSEGDSKHAVEPNGEPILKQVKQEPAEAGVLVSENSAKKDIKTKQMKDQNMKAQSGGLMLPSHSVPVVGQGKQQSFAPQQRPVGPLAQFPGHPLTQERPLGPELAPHLGPALHPQAEHLQHPSQKQSHGSEDFPGGIAGPGSGPPFGRFPGETESFPRLNAPMFGLPDDKFRPLADERINSFPSDPTRHLIDQGGIEDLKRFPRPSHLNTDRIPHWFGMDIAPRPLEKGPRAGSFGVMPPSRLFPPYDVGERDAARIQPDYIGPYRRHLDGMARRSPGRDYLGVSSRGFPVRGLDDLDGRDSRRFNDPMGNAFHDSRFPAPHSIRGDFDGPGRDEPPSNLPRGEHFGPRNLQSHQQLGDAPGFTDFPGHFRMGDFPGPGNFRGPRLGEPGFRSIFSQKGFPGDAGCFTGNLESLENSRKRRLPPSMGWCRICKVDCETAEGLDLHSQTSEHQKMAMDMVVTIKLNAKKQKLASSDRSSAEDGSKSKGTSVEGSGKED